MSYVGGRGILSANGRLALCANWWPLVGLRAKLRPLRLFGRRMRLLEGAKWGANSRKRAGLEARNLAAPLIYWPQLRVKPERANLPSSLLLAGQVSRAR